MFDIHSDETPSTTGKRPKQDDSASIHDQKVESLMSMGFPFETVVEALKESDNNVHNAVDSLFGRQGPGETSTTAHTNLPKSRLSDDKLTKGFETKHGTEIMQAENKDQHKSKPDLLNSQTLVTKPEDDGDKAEQKPRRLKRLFSALSRHRTNSVTKTSGDSTLDSSSTLSIQDHTLKTGSLSSRAREYDRIVRSIATRTLRRKCKSCDKFLLSDETHVKAFTQYLFEQNGKVEGIFCQNCSTLCITGGGDCLMVMLSLLCHFDINSRHNITNNDPVTKRWSLRPRPPRFKSKPNGIGYGGVVLNQSPTKKGHVESSQRFLADKDDSMTFQILTMLTALLPGTMGHETCIVEGVEIQALLHYSSLLDKVATMLRNNDLVDISHQAKLYTALIDFLLALVENPSTSTLVSEPRIVRKPEFSLLDIVLGSKEKRIGIVEFDTLQPLSQQIGCLADQCRTMLTSNGYEEADKKLYQCLVRLNDLLTVNDTGKDKVEPQDSNAWQKALRVVDVPDECISIDNQTLEADSASSVRPSGQIKRIMQEIARLQASLPDGIFVRYASSRPDKMKVLITGPQDTPYENGLFEFDLYCDSNFPAGPPKMLLRTTGWGKVRFNPNLYNTGMVCLSLLGTWSGEPWTAKSTLLQILVSIQAMVFCEKPWYNEPGRETTRDESRSDKYNTSLWPHVVQHGMIDWLDKILPPAQGKDVVKDEIPKESGIWDEVIRKHFSSNEAQILKRITKWTLHLGRVSAPSKRRSNAGPNVSEEEALNQELADYLQTAMPVLRKAPPLTAG